MADKPNRNEEPGLRAVPLDMTRTRQLIHHYVESTAVHSRSKGWLPMVKLDLSHVPLSNSYAPAKTLELVLDRDAIRGLTLALTAAIDRAEEDAQRGLLP